MQIILSETTPYPSEIVAGLDTNSNITQVYELYYGMANRSSISSMMILFLVIITGLISLYISKRSISKQIKDISVLNDVGKYLNRNISDIFLITAILETTSIIVIDSTYIEPIKIAYDQIIISIIFIVVSIYLIIDKYSRAKIALYAEVLTPNTVKTVSRAIKIPLITLTLSSIIVLLINLLCAYIMLS